MGPVGGASWRTDREIKTLLAGSRSQRNRAVTKLREGSPSHYPQSCPTFCPPLTCFCPTKPDLGSPPLRYNLTPQSPDLTNPVVPYTFVTAQFHISGLWQPGRPQTGFELFRSLNACLQIHLRSSEELEQNKRRMIPNSRDTTEPGPTEDTSHYTEHMASTSPPRHQEQPKYLLKSETEGHGGAPCASHPRIWELRS